MKKQALTLIITLIFTVMLCGAVSAASNECTVSIKGTDNVFFS